MVRSLRRLALFGAVASLALIGVVVGPTTAQSASTPVRGAPDKAHPNAHANAHGDGAMSYWTPDRMRHATPKTIGHRPGAPSVQPPASITRGLAPVAASSSTVTASSSAARLPREGFWPYSYKTMPTRPVGKLFFQEWDSRKHRWTNYVCSGSVVSAENKSLVWTAGHCVYNTFANRWNRKFLFCPAYKNGHCQLSRWGWTYVNTTPQWKRARCTYSGACTEREFNGDFGAIELVRHNHHPIQNKTGAHGIRYNVRSGKHWLFGYPAEGRRFNGQRVYYCSDRISFIHSHLRLQPCHSGGGTSGGPFLAGFNDNNVAWIDSICSHGRTGGDYEDGPFQGLYAERLYNNMRY